MGTLYYWKTLFPRR